MRSRRAFQQQLWKGAGPWCDAAARGGGAGASRDPGRAGAIVANAGAKRVITCLKCLGSSWLRLFLSGQLDMGSRNRENGIQYIQYPISISSIASRFRDNNKFRQLQKAHVYFLQVIV